MRYCSSAIRRTVTPSTLAAQTYRGSIGRLAVSVDVPIRSHFTVRYGIEHRSYIETNRDRGEERGLVGFSWRPFHGNH